MSNNEIILNGIIGKTITNITGLCKDSESVCIYFSDESKIEFQHDQNCCESVYLADFETDIDRIKGSKVIEAYESTNEFVSGDSETWTFYHINTTAYSLFMRWMGESNGYYSESVDIKDFAAPVKAS